MLTKLILVLFLNIFKINCYVFNVMKPVLIENGESYFGYSLLLQKGNTPSVVVGVPKRNKTNTQGGAVYRCDINTKDCKEFAFRTTANVNMNTQNFFGCAVDGHEDSSGSLFSCAPRQIRVNNKDYYTPGTCYFSTSSSSIFKQISLNSGEIFGAGRRRAFYKAAFGEMGMDIHYIKSVGKIMFGAPGYNDLNGNVLISDSNFQSELLVTSVPVQWKYELLGYKVASGFFWKNTLYYLASAPRGANLYGKVIAWKNTRYYSLRSVPDVELTGSELGAYFGYAILANDINEDGLDDIFVGAPMAAGKSWDEGCVYFYKHRSDNTLSFEKAVKIEGPRKPGARFGSAISPLGDIDLDGYKDIAISAPYEDEKGAVYIYLGGVNLMGNKFSQKISPEDFKINLPTSIKGFGFGLSKGLDIDYNGHTDIAVGAYKSGHVFIFKALPVIDFDPEVSFNVTSLTSETKSFTLTYCIYFNFRSKKVEDDKVNFDVGFKIDYRSTFNSGVVNKRLAAVKSQKTCENLTVSMKNKINEFHLFELNADFSIADKNVLAKENKQIRSSLSFSLGCGDDDICQTKLKIKALTNENKLITLGLDEIFKIVVEIDNEGEPAYSTELIMDIPQGVDLRDVKDCNLQNGTIYTCPVDNRMATKKEKSYTFDVRNISPDNEHVEFTFWVQALGVNLGNENVTKLSIPVVLKNDPYLEGKSDTISFDYNNENGELAKDEIIKNTFTLGNSGPSPMKIQITISVPFISSNTDIIFEVIDVNHKGVEGFSCEELFVPSTASNVASIAKELTLSVEKTHIIGCLDKETNCTQIICQGDYLEKSESVSFFVSILTNITAFAEKFEKIYSEKHVIALVVTAKVFSEQNEITKYVSTLIYGKVMTSIPLWVIIISVILGIILLCATIYGLYKCKFFKRGYKEKLVAESEQIIPPSELSEAEDQDL